MSPVGKYRRNIGAALLFAYLILETQTNLFQEYLLVKSLSVAGLFLATFLLFWGTFGVLVDDDERDIRRE